MLQSPAANTTKARPDLDNKVLALTSFSLLLATRPSALRPLQLVDTLQAALAATPPEAHGGFCSSNRRGTSSWPSCCLRPTWTEPECTRLLHDPRCRRLPADAGLWPCCPRQLRIQALRDPLALTQSQHPQTFCPSQLGRDSKGHSFRGWTARHLVLCNPGSTAAGLVQGRRPTLPLKFWAGRRLTIVLVCCTQACYQS